VSALIGLDWGTTNARAFRFDAEGAVSERREATRGILNVEGGRFADALAEMVGDWRRASPAAPILLCGMIGSRQGWREAPYVGLPAAEADLAGRLVAIEDGAIRIVPGVSGEGLSGAPDVIRGEETQIFGALELIGARSGTFCMPGSHSKWVEMRDGRLVRFATFLTGESFAALKDHTILGRLMSDAAAHDPDAFAAGLARARAPGGLLHHLFSVRSEGLFNRIGGDALASFLSGLLLGHEVQPAIAAFASKDVTIVGSAALAAPYVSAIDAFERRPRHVAGDDAVARGLWRIATAARLVRS
jgi:2-dehydro-3-deoxygalactonokinase